MGPVYLASSCLQGQPLTEAIALCESLGVTHLQLCPGNVPGLAARAAASRLSTRTHHGFSWSRLHDSVWRPDGSLAVQADSVHPPKRGQVDEAAWWKRFEQGEFGVLEVMYPPYLLGDDASVERALAMNTPLALDISHLHIMSATGALSAQTMRRLEAYQHIVEVHVSNNDGRADQHRPLHRDSFALGWAKERRAAGLPIILECYMHRLSHEARRQQLELLEGS